MSNMIILLFLVMMIFSLLGMQLFGGAFTAAKGYAGGAGFDPEADSIEIDGEIVAVSDLQEVPEIWGDTGRYMGRYRVGRGQRSPGGAGHALRLLCPPNPTPNLTLPEPYPSPNLPLTRCRACTSTPSARPCSRSSWR